jgi:hypothetical protein
MTRRRAFTVLLAVALALGGGFSPCAGGGACTDGPVQAEARSGPRTSHRSASRLLATAEDNYTAAAPFLADKLPLKVSGAWWLAGMLHVPSLPH